MEERPTCQRNDLNKNGSVAGKPKRQGQPWGSQCTGTTPRGKPFPRKITAVLLSLSGVSMHRIALFLRVSVRAGPMEQTLC